MKKALAIISALALVSAVAFAEDAALKLSGYVDTGIKTVTGDGKDSVQLWGDDSGSATRFDINGSYANGNSGVDFKLRQEIKADVDWTAPSINYFHVWSSLFDGKAKVIAGKLDNGAWKTEGDDGFTSENDEGVSLEILPIEGLNVGVKFNTNKTSAETPEQFFNELGFGGKYTSDLFNFAAGYKLDSDADVTTDKGVVKVAYAIIDAIEDAGVYTAAEATAAKAAVSADIIDNEAYAYAGFNFKGVENLKLIAEGKFMNLGKYADYGLTELDEIIEYKVSDPITAGILMYQYLPGDSDFKSQLSFKPYASYAVNEVVKATANVKYVMNSDYAEDVNDLSFTPGAEFQLSPSAKILVNDTYKIADMGDEIAKTTTNTIMVNFRYNF